MWETKALNPARRAASFSARDNPSRSSAANSRWSVEAACRTMVRVTWQGPAAVEVAPSLPKAEALQEGDEPGEVVPRVRAERDEDGLVHGAEDRADHHGHGRPLSAEPPQRVLHHSASSTAAKWLRAR